MSRRRAPCRIAVALLAAFAFAIGATSAMADPTPTTPVIDTGTSQPATTVDTTAVVDPALAGTAPAPTPAPSTTAPATTPAPTTGAVDPNAPVPPPAPPVPPAQVDPTAQPVPAATPVAPPPPVAPVEPTPDQLSPVLLAQVNATDAAAAAKSAADIPPLTTPARPSADTDGTGVAATPAAPPPTGDRPPAIPNGVRKETVRLAALVPSLVPVAPAHPDPGTAPRPREATATHAGPIWRQFAWPDIGAAGGSSDLGTRALLAIIGILPFAPLDGPDRSAPPSSQLALLIPIFGLVAFLFATRPIVDPRRRCPHRYRTVALKPG